MKKALFSLFASLSLLAGVGVYAQTGEGGLGQGTRPTNPRFGIPTEHQRISVHEHAVTITTNFYTGDLTVTNETGVPCILSDLSFVMPDGITNTIIVDVLRQYVYNQYKLSNVTTDAWGNVRTQAVVQVTNNYLRVVSTNRILAHTSTGVQSHVYVAFDNIAPFTILNDDVIIFDWSFTNANASPSWVTFTLTRK